MPAGWGAESLLTCTSNPNEGRRKRAIPGGEGQTGDPRQGSRSRAQKQPELVAVYLGRRSDGIGFSEAPALAAREATPSPNRE